MFAGRAARTILGILCAAGVSACALVTPLPEPQSLSARLAAFPTGDLPLEGDVRIHWDEHQIPFIVAETDSDAAFALGLVHAHLRLGQMETLRRIAEGRLAEIAGPPAADIDHGLRVLGYARAAERIASELPADTRAWLERFVEGINSYQSHLTSLPHEFELLGLEPETWTIADVIAVGRLAGTDVNWLVWFDVLGMRSRPDWPRIWERLVRAGSDSVTSFESAGRSAMLERLLMLAARSGSNSLALAPERTTTGSALLANDPHLGLFLPNLWILAGLKSPGIHAVGLMVPGLPAFAVGRNPWIAWGGTNMRAASSELVDVSDLPPEGVRRREERIEVRWWFDRAIEIRDTDWGPILSDVPQLADLNLPQAALRWTGHTASDEIGALLRVNRARDFTSFRQAFQSFAVSGQNMLYADAEGNIGQVLAVRIPARTTLPETLIVSRADSDTAWRRMLTVENLPYSYNPSSGFLASANNRPTESRWRIGYFFSPNDRVRRMQDIVEAKGKLSPEDLESMQRDVFMESATALRNAFLQKLEEADVETTPAREEVIRRLREWDGRYLAESRGPVAFELVRAGFTGNFYAGVLGPEDGEAFAGVSWIKTLLVEDLERMPAAAIGPLLANALDTAAENMDDFANWGEMHRLVVRHPLSLLPLIGDRYEFADLPVAGSTDTLMKTAHGRTLDRHATRYGSNARHISDLSDMDANYFVLLGGEDGWINSSTFIDQLDLWRSGEYVKLPLTLETVRARARHTTELAGR